MLPLLPASCLCVVIGLYLSGKLLAKYPQVSAEVGLSRRTGTFTPVLVVSSAPAVRSPCSLAAFAPRRVNERLLTAIQYVEPEIRLVGRSGALRICAAIDFIPCTLRLHHLTHCAIQSTPDTVSVPS